MSRLRAAGAGPGALVAVAIAPRVGGALVHGLGPDRTVLVAEPEVLGPVVVAVEAELGPRWVWWSPETATELGGLGVRPARVWDVAAVHRLLFGGWRADPARAWARLHDVPGPVPGPPADDLFAAAAAAADDPDRPVRADGHVHPAWTAGGWAEDADRCAAWAGLALDAAAAQQVRIDEIATATPPGDPARLLATARSESAAELLGAELAAEGLPMDRDAAEAIIAGYVGPRPRTDAEAAALRRARDDEVLRLAPAGTETDLRSPAQVRSLLRRIGIEVPDTRAWRLEARRDEHPLVEALLAWRKAERIATTYGYAWLDAHLGEDGRLRGAWTGSDGAAGRMTASAGLHNMPADLRGAVLAERGCVFVRADLGQIEPRVLAAVAGDDALARATLDDDLYAPVARQLGVDRATAKVAVLGAMYGQTTGHGAQALRRLRSTYPVAMAYLDAADQDAQAGHDLRTFGGRRIRMGSPATGSLADPNARQRDAARGRYGRNAVVQGAAAELFKAWAATVRTRTSGAGARIVLCLHDELLVHVPDARGAEVARAVDDALAEAAHRWHPGAPVRFLSSTTVVRCWADAKA